MTSDDAGSVPVALREMTDGIAYFRRRGWPPDLHSSCYEAWAEQNPGGDFTVNWWTQYQLPRLVRWIATRPVRRAVLTARFTEGITALNAAWEDACRPHLDDDIAAVAWEDVSAFPEEVAKIKPMKSGRPSAVFTSKFCHFLLPRVFPVVDNAGLGSVSRTYESHFRRVQDEWAGINAETQKNLVTELTKVIIEAEGRPVFRGFPVINKIVELRLIGRYHGHATY